jgi:hypothetical protein
VARLCHNAPAVDTNREEGDAVEKYGLSVKELEAQRVELLPDRIEMGRRRNRVRVTCANQQQAISLFSTAANIGINVCPVQVGNF